MKEHENIDEAMLPFSELVEELASIEAQAGSKQMGVIMEIERLKAGLPLQLDLLTDENGRVVLGGSPPLYYVETTFLPVFHSITYTLEKIE